MPDMTVPAVLFALVLLILLGQWFMVRRAQSMKGQPVPDELLSACKQLSEATAVSHVCEKDQMDALITFDAPNCGACHKMAPTLAEIAAYYPGRVFSLSVTEYRALAQKLRIMGTPTMLLIHQGRIVDVFVGITPSERILQRLQQTWPDIPRVDVAPK